SSDPNGKRAEALCSPHSGFVTLAYQCVFATCPDYALLFTNKPISSARRSWLDLLANNLLDRLSPGAPAIFSELYYRLYVPGYHRSSTHRSTRFLASADFRHFYDLHHSG